MLDDTGNRTAIDVTELNRYAMLLYFVNVDYLKFI